MHHQPPHSSAGRVQELVSTFDQLAVMTERETSDKVKLSMVTLQRMRKAGTGPKFVKLSEKRIGYRVADLADWLNAWTTQIAA